jgi:serine/threonine-protein kinase RsbT
LNDRTLAARIPSTDPWDRYACASIVARVAKTAGFSEKDCAEIACAAAELASNAVRHGGGGYLEVWRLHPEAGIEIICFDHGPGFDDIERAQQDGFSRGSFVRPTESSVGSGLGAVRRAMHSLTVESRRGKTIVLARRYVRRPGAAEPRQ